MPNRISQRGYSLIETMIAAVLGIVVVKLTYDTVIDAKSFQKSNQNKSSATSNAHMLINTIKRDYKFKVQKNGVLVSNARRSSELVITRNQKKMRGDPYKVSFKTKCVKYHKKNYDFSAITQKSSCFKKINCLRGYLPHVSIDISKGSKNIASYPQKIFPQKNSKDMIAMAACFQKDSNTLKATVESIYPINTDNKKRIKLDLTSQSISLESHNFSDLDISSD